MDADVQGENWMSAFRGTNEMVAAAMFKPISPLIGVHRRSSAVSIRF
jgi:hypothetical protein